MKKVLITGALGQDGKILSQIYLRKKFKVFGIIKKKNKNCISNVEYVCNNLSNRNKITILLKQINPNIIIHLASINNSFSKRKKENHLINYKKNINFSKNLINSICKSSVSCKFLFAGSSLMFSKTRKEKVNEKNKFNSNDLYGKYKIDIFNFLKNKKINATTLILFNHDSEHRGKEFLIPKLVKAFKNKNNSLIKRIYSLNISGDFSIAEDICNGIYKMSLCKKKIDKIILSSNKRLYINDIIKYLEKKTNHYIPGKKIEKNSNNRKIIGSNNLAKKIIKFESKKNLYNLVNKLLKN